MTVEPGIYIPDEGFAVRLENDVLITDRGPVDLMTAIPIKAEDIKAPMISRKASSNDRNGHRTASANPRRQISVQQR